MSLDLRLCDRCGVDARAWDREQWPVAREHVTRGSKTAHYVFCRRCAQLLKKRLEKADQQHD